MISKSKYAFVLVFVFCALALSAQRSLSAGLPVYDGTPGTTAGQQCVNPQDHAVMVWVPAGNFLMGSTDADKSADRSEKPQHTVLLDGYWIYQNDVTVAQYKAYCAAAGVDMPKNAPAWGWQDTHPMVGLTWQMAHDYAAWAAAKLPSEAQWEKAARGTDGKIYPWGDAWDAAKCNNKLTNTEKTLPVGSFPDGASPYGCLDMAGNVWNWCEDWLAPDYYTTSPAHNPTGPDTGKKHVLRGGSCKNSNPTFFRCGNRIVTTPASLLIYCGFRCVVTPAGQ